MSVDDRRSGGIELALVGLIRRDGFIVRLYEFLVGSFTGVSSLTFIFEEGSAGQRQGSIEAEPT